MTDTPTPEQVASLADRAHLVIAKLRTWYQPPHKAYPTNLINPDGEEAAALIEELLSRLEARQ